MPKRLTAMRLSPYTDQQLEKLAVSFGMNKTEIIQLAIDRLYQAEIGVPLTEVTQAEQPARTEASDGK